MYKKKNRNENSILKGELIFVRCCYTITSVHVYFRLIASVINSHQIFYFAIAPFAFKIFV